MSSRTKIDVARLTISEPTNAGQNLVMVMPPPRRLVDMTDANQKTKAFKIRLKKPKVKMIAPQDNVFNMGRSTAFNMARITAITAY